MKTNQRSTARDPEALLNELRSLVLEAEKIIGDSASSGASEALKGVRERFEAAQQRLASFYSDAKQKVSDGAAYADDVVRTNPYQSIAVGAVAGILVGLLVGRATK
jgi:ElaB/YqjD/DUF883 family membrane-anchored ribosome-binding protein